MEEFRAYLDGSSLYGDDFDAEQIAEWHADEKEAYANLGANDPGVLKYGYHGWNWFHGFRHLGGRRFDHALGFGSAYGDEFIPVVNRLGRITIVDPSDAFTTAAVAGVPVTYLKPSVTGDLPLTERSVDLITCFGVLHHIPNVTHVVGELARVLSGDGTLLLREPINSMGDWRRPRRGLTKRERGIPLHLMEGILGRAGLRVERRALCGFPLVPRIFRLFREDAYNSGAAVRLDASLAWAFGWNRIYHPTHFYQKFRPTSAFWVLRRD